MASTRLFFLLWLVGLRLLLLLGHSLRLFGRLIDQGGDVAISVGLFGKYQPSVRHVQEPKLGFRIGCFMRSFNALGSV